MNYDNKDQYGTVIASNGIVNFWEVRFPDHGVALVAACWDHRPPAINWTTFSEWYRCGESLLGLEPHLTTAQCDQKSLSADDDQRSA